MAGSFDEVVGRACGRWIAYVDRRPALVVGITLILTVFLGIYAALNLGVNADPDAMISADLPFRQREREFQRTFRAANDDILILVDGDSASAAGRAADALRDRLAQRTDLFDVVQVVGGGAFFDRNALLYLDTKELEDLSDRLANVQPFLAEIAHDPSLVGISDLLRQAVKARHDGVNVGLDLAPALDRVSVAIEAASAGRAAPDPWGDALIGGSMSEEARHRVIAIRPQEKFDELLFAEPAVRAIRDAARDLSLDADHGVTVRVTGSAILNYEELLAVNVQGKVVAVVSFVLFTVAVFFALRSVRVVLALAVSLFVSLIWSNAFATVAVGHLNQVSAVFNVLIVGLGGELGIHVCMRYAELVAQGRSRAEALIETGESIGSSLVSSAGTTAIGFLVFLPTDYRGVAELGLISGGGMLLSLASSLTVLPALLSLGAGASPRVAPAEIPWAARMRHLPVKYARAIRISAAVVALVSVVLLPRARFDHNPVNLRDPRTESVQAFQDLLSRSTTSPWTIDVLTPDLATAEALAKRLAGQEPVKQAITVLDFVPSDQEAKRAILEEAALFVPPVGPPGAPPDAAAQLAALGALEAELARPDAGAAAEDAPLQAAEKRLRDALAGLRARVASAGAPDALLAQVQSNVVGTLPEQLEGLVTSLTPDRVTLDVLPAELKDQMLAPDGTARIQVFAKKDLSDSAALEEFMDSVGELAPNMTGPAVGLVEWGRVTSGAMKQALVVGLASMAIFLMFLWRNVWDTVLAFFPLALAAAVTVATMVALGMQFNFANVIVLPMLLGMGIDNGVHLVHRHRTNPEEVDVLGTSTARAVFFAAFTTILSFGSLAFASHRGMAALGQILTLGVGATLVCYVVVLPAVLEWDDQRARRRRERLAA